MDSDTALRFELTAIRSEESTIDARENHASAIRVAPDEGEAQEEAGDPEPDERGAEDEDEDQEEGEGESAS